jgi:hypothetical protein
VSARAEDTGGDQILAFAVKDREVADYHYRLYREIASLAAGALDPEKCASYEALLREELGANAHGEVDDESWQLKQSLRRRQTNMRRPTKGFAEYARASLTDTLTLYLHGICCDIDVETGPRQLASRYLRRRLKLLAQLLPAPKGYAVFPEDLDEDARGASPGHGPAEPAN